MTEQYYVGAYWGVRKESSLVCSRQATQLLVGLAKCDPLFNTWFKLGNSRRQAMKEQVQINEDALHRLMLDGQNRTDFGEDIIKELGFRIGLWTGGKSTESASLSISCGCYSSAVGVNSCILNLPTQEEAIHHLLDIDTLANIIETMVIAWEPDWVIVTSREYRNLARKQPVGVQLVGWMNYLKHSAEILPDLPPTAHVRRLNSKGSLVVVTEERFTADNLSQVAMADEVGNILYRAGVLYTKAEA